MNTKTKNILLISVTCLLSYLYYYNFYHVDENNSEITHQTVPMNELSTEDNSNKKRKKNSTPLVSDDAQYIVDALAPISKEVLADSWKLEFGCFTKSKRIDSDTDSCDNMFLTARSFEEALWMQRQGYPSSSDLNLLEDSRNLIYLEELANKNKYTPAMALLAIQGLNDNKFEDASSMALKLTAYSSNTDTFPHRIRGEALLAKNDMFFGLSALKVASLLGDIEAKYLFNRYIQQYPILAVQAADHANLYMGRVFNVAYGQYPVDIRPQESDGG